jgi:hypothetical protein
MTQTLDYKPTRLEILQREQREADQARQHALQAAIDQRATDVRDWAALPGKKKDHAKLFAELAALQAKHNSLLAEAHNIAKNQAPPLRAKYEALDAAVSGQSALRERLVAGAASEARDDYLAAEQARDQARFDIQNATGAVRTAEEAARVLAGPTPLDRKRVSANAVPRRNRVARTSDRPPSNMTVRRAKWPPVAQDWLRSDARHRGRHPGRSMYQTTRLPTGNAAWPDSPTTTSPARTPTLAQDRREAPAPTSGAATAPAAPEAPPIGRIPLHTETRIEVAGSHPKIKNGSLPSSRSHSAFPR